MHKLYSFLEHHPYLSISASTGAGIISFLDVINPILQSLSLVAGITLAAITIYQKTKKPQS